MYTYFNLLDVSQYVPFYRLVKNTLKDGSSADLEFKLASKKM